MKKFDRAFKHYDNFIKLFNLDILINNDVHFPCLPIVLVIKNYI